MARVRDARPRVPDGVVVFGGGLLESRAARGGKVPVLPVEAMREGGFVTELDTATFDELVDEIQKRTNSFVLVVEVDGKDKGYLTNRTFHAGSFSAVLGLLEWGTMFWRRNVSLDFDDGPDE